MLFVVWDCGSAGYFEISGHAAMSWQIASMWSCCSALELQSTVNCSALRQRQWPPPFGAPKGLANPFVSQRLSTTDGTNSSGRNFSAGPRLKDLGFDQSQPSHPPRLNPPGSKTRSYCGWTNSRTTLKPLEIIVCWFLQGNHHSRDCYEVQDFVHPQ